MKKFKKVYIEITNKCNLNCNFCPKTTRTPKQLTSSEFNFIAQQVASLTDYVNLHLMGEPLLHTELDKILQICKEYQLKPSITTNGTLLKQNIDVLLNANLFKLTISLHCFEFQTNLKLLNEYLTTCLESAKQIANSTNTFVELRLWNLKSNLQNKYNENLIKTINKNFSTNINLNQNENVKVQKNVYLTFGNVFKWPIQNKVTEKMLKNARKISLSKISRKLFYYSKKSMFCYALRTHFGILSNGDVVPCCLDNNANLCLGNIFSTNLVNILNSEKAINIYNGFSRRIAVEPFCKRCNFVNKF